LEEMTGEGGDEEGDEDVPIEMDEPEDETPEPEAAPVAAPEAEEVAAPAQDDAEEMPAAAEAEAVEEAPAAEEATPAPDAEDIAQPVDTGENKPKRKPWEAELLRLVAEAEAADDAGIAAARYVDAAEKALSIDASYPPIPDWVARAVKVGASDINVLKSAAAYYEETERWEETAKTLETLTELSNKTDRVT